MNLLEPRSHRLFDVIRERRGWSYDQLKNLNDPTHAPLKDMDVMVDILHRIHTENRHLVIMPDFDMDGITSGVIGYTGFAELGFTVDLYVPDYHRGHGFHVEDVHDIMEQFPTVDAILTCDTGISSFDAITEAQSHNLTVLITDHHLQTEGISSADVIIDPARVDETYEHPDICGAHVLYQVILAYAEAHDPERIDTLRWLSVFAGMGTISDVMPLLYENRALVIESVSRTQMLMPTIRRNHWGKVDMRSPIDLESSTGMGWINEHARSPIFRSAFLGVSICLAEFAKLGKLRNYEDINAGFYGFYLAPAFNAIRRVDTPMIDAFTIFFGSTIPEKVKAMQSIIETNDRRKIIVKEITETMETEYKNGEQPYAPYIWLTTAPAGLCGLLANVFMKANRVPTLVINRSIDDGTLSGSARSPEWLDINTLMNTHRDRGYRAIGHAHACGVRISEDDQTPLDRKITDLIKLIEDEMKTILESINPDDLGPAVDLTLGTTAHAGDPCDADIDDMDALIQLTDDIIRTGPYGRNFTEPIIKLQISLSEAEATIIGKDRNHVNLTLENGLKCLWWNGVDHLLDINERIDSGIEKEQEATIIGKFSINTFGYETSADFIIDTIQYMTD